MTKNSLWQNFFRKRNFYDKNALVNMRPIRYQKWLYDAIQTKFKCMYQHTVDLCSKGPGRRDPAGREICLRPPSKIITFIFSFGIRWFPIPNLVLRTIIMVKKVYGLKICVFVACSRGATSGSSLSAVFTLYQPILLISALCLHFTTMKKK